MMQRRDAERPLRPQDLIEHLRVERRSFIIGTLVVWFVVVIAATMLLISMKPQLMHQQNVTSMSQAVKQAEAVGTLTPEQDLLVQLVFFVGAIALFFLNWRFSAMLQRPQGAFGPPGTRPRFRWLWWIALALNSYFFFPQLVVTPLLAHWGTQEIARRSAALRRGTPPEDESGLTL